MGQVMHNVQGRAGCGPGDAQCARQAVGQVMHNVQGRAGCGPGDAQCAGQGRLWAR